MYIRRILIFIVSLLDEAIVVAAVLWGLPRSGISIPLPGLVIIGVALSAYAVVTYRLIMRALGKRPVIGLSDMVGTRGRVVSPLAPEGAVRIKGELWQAVADGGRVDTGNEVIVVSHEGLKLTVHKVSPDKKRR